MSYGTTHLFKKNSEDKYLEFKIVDDTKKFIDRVHYLCKFISLILIIEQTSSLKRMSVCRNSREHTSGFMICKIFRSNSFLFHAQI